MIETMHVEASLVWLPVWAMGGVVLGKVAATLHETFDRWKHARAVERARDAALLERYGALSTLGSRTFETYVASSALSGHFSRVLTEGYAVASANDTTDYDRMLRDALKAGKGRPSYDASGHPVPSFTLEDFMHLQPAPMPGPIANTRSAEAIFAERDAVLERAEKHKAYLARTLKLKVEKQRAEEEYRARAPHQWRCDKCGYTETLTDDEVAIRADGVGDLWTAHWPAKAQGDAADILCDGRVIRIGGAR